MTVANGRALFDQKHPTTEARAQAQHTPPKRDEHSVSAGRALFDTKGKRTPADNQHREEGQAI